MIQWTFAGMMPPILPVDFLLNPRYMFFMMVKHLYGLEKNSLVVSVFFSMGALKFAQGIIFYGFKSLCMHLVTSSS